MICYHFSPPRSHLADYGLLDKSGLSFVFVDKVLLEPCSVFLFTYCIWLLLHFNSNGIVAAETVWLTNPKYSPPCYLQKVYADPFRALPSLQIPLQRGFALALLDQRVFLPLTIPSQGSFFSKSPFHSASLLETFSFFSPNFTEL